MPIIKSAKKKLRQDKKRTLFNLKEKKKVKEAINKFKETPNQTNLSKTFSSLDKAVKKNILHKNKASRVKSSLSKLINNKVQKAAIVKKPKNIKVSKNK